MLRQAWYESLQGTGEGAARHTLRNAGATLLDDGAVVATGETLAVVGGGKAAPLFAIRA